MRIVIASTVAVLSLVLGACSSPGPRYTFFTPATADQIVAQKAGTTVPTTVSLYHSYEENWTLRQPDDFLNTTFSCNGSKILRGERKFSFRSQEGNLVKGMLLTSDQCGSSGMSEITGRYNGEYLFIYYPAQSETSVQAYRLVNGGRILVREINFSMYGGSEFAYRFPLNGGKDGEKTYMTSNFLATTDQSIANSGLGNQKAVGAPAAEPPGTLADKVKQLKALFDQGLLTEEEYKTQRDELIKNSMNK